MSNGVRNPDRDWYLNIMRNFKQGNQASNRSLLEKYQSGDESALGQLIGANLRLVYKHAQRYCNGSEDILHDLMQLGALGLVEAAKRFDLTTTNAFTTYATNYIKMDMRSYHGEYGAVRLPRHAAQNANMLYKACVSAGVPAVAIHWDAIRAELLKQGTSSAAALTVNDLVKFRWLPVVNSYDAAIGSDKSESDGDGLSGEESVSRMVMNMADDAVEDVAEQSQMSSMIERLVSTLSGKEQDIVRKYYQLSDATEEHTLQSLGDQYGVSRERIRQIQQKALFKLRELMSSEGLTFSDFVA
jgi:RNA polymerase primary sigma factor